MSAHILKSDFVDGDLQLPIEPYFFYAESKELLSISSCSSDAHLRYINYKIADKPASITQHVRKIKLLQARASEPELLFSALIDLFLLLKDKGFDLRRRMLSSSKSSLSKLMYITLLGKLKSGDLSKEKFWASELSMLPFNKEKAFKVSVIEVGTCRGSGSSNGL